MFPAFEVLRRLVLHLHEDGTGAIVGTSVQQLFVLTDGKRCSSTLH